MEFRPALSSCAGCQGSSRPQALAQLPSHRAPFQPQLGALSGSQMWAEPQAHSTPQPPASSEKSLTCLPTFSLLWELPVKEGALDGRGAMLMGLLGGEWQGLDQV